MHPENDIFQNSAALAIEFPGGHTNRLLAHPDFALGDITSDNRQPHRQKKALRRSTHSAGSGSVL